MIVWKFNPGARRTVIGEPKVRPGPVTEIFLQFSEATMRQFYGVNENLIPHLLIICKLKIK